MFKIGEFSKLGQVSGRMLRHYDQLGLLKPEYTDPFTGYRYYTASQLPRLNRILALKELGLSLEQIERFLNSDISVEEIRGMLLMKQAEMEQMLRKEIERFRYIESRIRQIEAEGQLKDYGVVLKQIPAQHYLAVREVCANFDVGLALMGEMINLLPSRVGRNNLGQLTIVNYSEVFETENIDVEMGYVLNAPFSGTITLSNGETMTERELPAIEQAVTSTRIGAPAEAHLAFNAIAFWVDANRYEIIGPGREVVIQPPIPGKEHETVTEVQFPVRKLPDTVSLIG